MVLIIRAINPGLFSLIGLPFKLMNNDESGIDIEQELILADSLLQLICYTYIWLKFF